MRGGWLLVPVLLLAACSDDDDFGPGPGTGEPPETPAALSSVSLDGAIALTWGDNAFEHDPDLFQNYRVYSTSYDLDRGQCGTSWSLEGTTVAPEFVVGSLENGVPRCFAVTAESTDGVESARSGLRQDTPRPDARNIVLDVRQVDLAGAGFRFWQDFDGDGLADGNELGLVARGDAADIDFAVDRDTDGTIFLTPVRAGTSVAIYGETFVDDLTSIDVAPETGFARSAVEAKPMWGYVFEMNEGDGFPRYGAVRVTHVGQTLVILDWAYQPDPGNPELVRGAK